MATTSKQRAGATALAAATSQGQATAAKPLERLRGLPLVLFIDSVRVVSLDLAGFSCCHTVWGECCSVPGHWPGHFCSLGTRAFCPIQTREEPTREQLCRPGKEGQGRQGRHWLSLRSGLALSGWWRCAVVCGSAQGHDRCYSIHECPHTILDGQATDPEDSRGKLPARGIRKVERPSLTCCCHL